MFRHFIFVVALLLGSPQLCWALDIVTRDEWEPAKPIDKREKDDAAKWREKQIKYLKKMEAIKSEREVRDNIEYEMPLRTGAVYLTLHATLEDFVGHLENGKPKKSRDKLTVKEKVQAYQKKMQEGYSFSRGKYYLFALPGDLPYNYIVLKDGNVAEGREYKYGPFSNTTYKTDMAKHITVVLEGKFDDEKLKGKQRDALLELLAILAKAHDIDIENNFSFHQKVSKEHTSCPGTQVIADFKDLRTELKKALKQ